MPVERNRLWLAQGLCAAGQGMGLFLLSWSVLAHAHGAGGLGLCLGAGLIATAAVLWPASRNADRVSRRRLMTISQLALALVALVLALVEPVASLWLFVVATGISGAARAVFDASAHAVLQHTVPEDRIRRAIRDLTSRYYFGQLAGVALAAGVATLRGPQIAYAVCGVVFAAGAAVSATHHIDLDLPPEHRPAVDHALRRSWQALRASAELRVLTACSVIAGLLAGVSSASFAPYLRQVLGFGITYRLVLASGIAALAVAILAIPAVLARVHWKAILIICLVSESVALSVIGTATGPRQAAIGDGLLLIATAIVGAAIHQRRATRVPDPLRVPIGLAGGIVSSLALAAGALAAGPLGGWLGLAGEYTALAGVGVIACAITIPLLLGIDRRGQAAARPVAPRRAAGPRFRA